MSIDSLRRLVFRLSRNPLSIAGAVIVLIIITFTLAAPLLAPYPRHIGTFVDFANASHPPSVAHWFGTDDIGRDILSRVIFGLRTSLGLSIVVLAIAVPVGVVIGLIAGYFGGLAGSLLMRITDVFLALPPLVLAMAIVGLLAPTMTNVMVAISVMYWPWHTRLAYSLARSIRHEDYVAASRIVGASDAHIMFSEILPNCVPSILIKTTFDLAFVILLIASLGFVGLGVQPPTPDLGRMVADGVRFLPFGWWISVFPGLMVMLAVLGFSLFGDGLRDALEDS
jgi:peptide/nickel transport system permease protein